MTTDAMDSAGRSPAGRANGAVAPGADIDAFEEFAVAARRALAG